MGDIKEAIAETGAAETDSCSESVSTGSVTGEGDLRIGGVIRTCGKSSLVHPTVVSLLLSASVERCFVSRMRDF